MPPVSNQQAKAMFAAASGHSTLGIPQSVGREFVDSPLPPEQQAQRGAKRKTHRGRRSKGKGAKAHHADAKQHMAAGMKAKSPAEAHAHLFRAISSLNKAKKADPQPEPSQFPV